MTNFDERAKDWDADPMKVERARIVAAAIRSALPLGPFDKLRATPGTCALEYGCGTGLLGFALQPYLASVTLADTSQGMLDVLAGKIKAAGAANMHPLRLDLCADPLPAARYHVIYSLMTLHHIPDTAGILQKFHAVLEPGGWLALADLDREDGSFHGPEVTDVHHGFERTELQSLAESAGFGGVTFTTVYEIPKAGRRYPVFLMTARKGT
ncbi:MAG: S-adenosylmethionine-dependent methyltransferase [Anaerolineaceae bacterium]|nr:MAG: S-adenosylmethionine-dependent methyltransferase [Anaerolineaceae bacterium]